MANTVYMLGAGVNQAAQDNRGLSPPLINDFFQVALRKRKFSNKHYTDRIQPVYDYIQRYWHRDRNSLASDPFDLEECFSMLDLQLGEAISANDKESLSELYATGFKLKSFVAEVLSYFEDFAWVSEVMQSFGKVLYKEKPAVLTFNYDCLVEAVIEHASGGNLPVPEEFFRLSVEGTSVSNKELAYSHFNWNRPLGYGVKFHTVELSQAGPSRRVNGNRFYSHPNNKVYPWSILKLHGSLNWFRYLPIRKYPQYPVSTNWRNVPLSKEKKKEVILMRGTWWDNDPPDLEGWYLDPLIIAPIVHKGNITDNRLYPPIFRVIWNKAENVLSQCTRLVVIGYSFPSADLPIRKLLREVFSEHALHELVVVNPDTSVCHEVKDLCHFHKSITICENLEEFLSWQYQEG